MGGEQGQRVDASDLLPGNPGRNEVVDDLLVVLVRIHGAWCPILHFGHSRSIRDRGRGAIRGIHCERSCGADDLQESPFGNSPSIWTEVDTRSIQAVLISRGAAILGGGYRPGRRRLAPRSLSAGGE